MAEVGFPSRHTTTTTVQTTQVQTDIRFDPLYLRTIPGYLKIAQIVLNLLGFICIQCSDWSSLTRANFFNTISMTGFWFTGILLAFYLFHVIEKTFKIPWPQIEFFYCVSWTGLLFLVSIFVLAMNADGAFTAAAFFGFCAMVAYGYDAWLKWLVLQAGELAQGERNTSKQMTTVTTGY